MRTFLRILAVLGAIAFVITTCLVLVFRPLILEGVHAGVYKQALAEGRVYEKTPALVGDAVQLALKAREERRASGEAEATAEEQAMEAIIRQLEPEDWTTLLGAIVPPELLRTEVERGLDAADRFLHGTGESTDSSISLLEVKRRLLGAEATDAYAKMLATKPACTAEQYEASFGLPVACRPTPDQMAEALEHFRQLTRMAAEQLPDQFDLLEGLHRLDGPEGQAEVIAEVRARVRMAALLAQWSPIVPAALALLIALFAVRSVRGLFLWWGIPCVIAGGICALMTAPFVMMGPSIIQNMTTEQFPPDVPIQMMETFLGVFTALARGFMMPVLWPAVVLGAGGALALVMAQLIRPKAPLPQPPPLRG